MYKSIFEGTVMGICTAGQRPGNIKQNFMYQLHDGQLLLRFLKISGVLNCYSCGLISNDHFKPAPTVPGSSERTNP